MRSLSRTLVGLAVAGGLLILPITQSTYAASSSTHHGMMPQRLSAIAAVEGVTVSVLQQDLKAGQTLLHIAQDAHSTSASSAHSLAIALLAPTKTRLDQAVTAHHLTQAQENQRYTALLARWTTLVTTPHPQLGGFTGSNGKQGHWHGKPKA